ncbi:MAG: lytic transglycosylase domain-containing protein [Leptospiraceae bacterium]|nr:lytic transglycosylase domain-containing protein [Leptospiraceae bacterium]
MDIKDIQSVQDIFQRIKEIESIPKELEAKTEKIFETKKPKSEFQKELEAITSEKEESIPEIPVKVLSTPGSKFKSNTKLSLNSIIEKESKRNGLDPSLVKAVIKAESNFNPKAVSHAGAKGLMQLMPETAEMLGVEDSFNPKQNVKGGTKYLKDLLATFKDKDLALAAYNAGPNAVKRYKGIPPYSETKEYVRKVNEFYEDYKE